MANEHGGDTPDDGDLNDVLGEPSTEVGAPIGAVGAPLSSDGLTQVSHEQSWFEAFPGVDARVIEDPVDGLLRPDDADLNAMIPLPALGTDTLVCLADESEYVEVFAGELSAEQKSLLEEVSSGAMGWTWTRGGESSHATFDSACVPGNSLGAQSNTDLDEATAEELLAVSGVCGLDATILRARFDAKGRPQERRRFAPEHTAERFGLRWGLTLAKDAPPPPVFLMDPSGHWTFMGSGMTTFVRCPEYGPNDKGSWAKNSMEKEHARIVEAAVLGTPLCLVRPKREVCRHFSMLLTRTDEVLFENKPTTPIHMYCDAYKTVGGAKLSVNETAVTACSLRSPRDPESEALLSQRIDRKIGEGKARTFLPMFKDVRTGPPVDWKVEAAAFNDRALLLRYEPDLSLCPGVPSDVHPVLDVRTPCPTDGLSASVRHLVLADAAWQPPEEFYQVPVVGQDRPWGTGGTGQMVLRLTVDLPSYSTEEDAVTWPSFTHPMLGMALIRAAAACADGLRRGSSVRVVVGNPKAQGAFFAALVVASLKNIPGLDALSELEKLWGTELATNLSHRCFLRNVR